MELALALLKIKEQKVIAPTTNPKRRKTMKVKELIKALLEKPQDAEVFYLTGDSGMYQVNTVKSAAAIHDEVKEITGDEFVVLV